MAPKKTSLGFTIGGRFYHLPNWASFLVRRCLLVPFAQLTRGTTLGAQALAFNENGAVLLIRQAYTSTWQFPGGGVDAGEDIESAVIRELKEEANANPVTSPKLFGLYTNFSAMPGDHIALFVIDRVEVDAFPLPGAEIIDHGFFAPDNFPENTAGSVIRRIAEVKGSRPQSAEW